MQWMNDPSFHITAHAGNTNQTQCSIYLHENLNYSLLETWSLQQKTAGRIVFSVENIFRINHLDSIGKIFFFSGCTV